MSLTPFDGRIGIIGAGRVGMTLAAGFALAGADVAAVWSRTLASAEALSRYAPGCSIEATAQRVVDASDLVFVTTADDAIAPTVAGLRWRLGAAVAHCSGACDLDVLAAAAAQGALTGSFHPLQAIASPEQALAALRGAAVALAGDDALVALLTPLATALGGWPIRVPVGSRALYHASCSFASPFIVALLREAGGIWESFGISRQDSLRALLPLLRATLEVAERDGVDAALGGPLTRGDTGTIVAHLAALHAAVPQTEPLYRDLSRRLLPIAGTRGTLSLERAAELAAVLGAPDGPSRHEPSTHEPPTDRHR